MEEFIRPVINKYNSLKEEILPIKMRDLFYTVIYSVCICLVLAEAFFFMKLRCYSALIRRVRINQQIISPIIHF